MTEAWFGDGQRRCETTKTVHYTCGCKVVLENFGEQSAGLGCSKHLKSSIAKVVTMDRYYD